MLKQNQKKVWKLSIMAVLGIATAIQYSAQAQTQDVAGVSSGSELPGLYHCDIELASENRVVAIRNLMSRPGATNPARPVRFDKSGFTSFTYPDQPEARDALGIASGCLSLEAKTDRVFMSEADAQRTLIPLSGGGFADVCWFIGTGQRDPQAGPIQDGNLLLTFANRKVMHEADKNRLSLSTADYDMSSRPSIVGEGEVSQDFGEVRVTARCEYR